MTSKVAEGAWTAFLTQEQKQLLEQAWYLLDREKELGTNARMVDYGYLVFSVAKVYEGYLKTFFYQMGFISKKHYHNEHFRIGKSLNPDLPNRYRDEEWVYDDVAHVCGESLARQLWRAWKRGRNQVFHYTAQNGERLTLHEAELRVEEIVEAMETAAGCEVNVKA